MIQKIFVAILFLTLSESARADKDLWYADFNYKLGLSTTYSDGVNNQLNSIGATNKSTSGLEFAARFKTIVPTLYLGGTFARYVNKFDSNAGDSITALIPTGSLVYSPLEDPANGPFGRVDLGLGFVSRPGASDSGLCYVLGFGWGFPFSEDFGMYPIFTYANIYGQESYSFTTLGVGFIF